MATETLKTVSSPLQQMQRLGDLVREKIEGETLDRIEKAGKEPTTSSEAFEGRNGYEAPFLEQWNIPIPIAKSEHEQDMRKLRRGGSGFELKYQNFSVIMSVSRRLPMITAANIDGASSVTKVPRITSWYFDGRLNKEDQWGDAIYDNNILDRGHMVRREDPIWGDNWEIANRDTFHFTNSCPQVAGVNQKTWLGLENFVLHHARVDGMKVNVYTGPFFRADDIEYKGAQIPSAFWKVIAIVTEDGRRSATAYKVSQERELEELEYVYKAYKTFQISIQEVMDNTQLDFANLLPYDGFSEHERVTGRRIQERIDHPENIRI